MRLLSLRTCSSKAKVTIHEYEKGGGERVDSQTSAQENQQKHNQGLHMQHCDSIRRKATAQEQQGKNTSMTT